MLKHETRKNITYENIELIKKGREQELKEDIENRTGITVNRLAVGKIDFLSDTANVTIYYFETDE